jgi:hypothetical protein
MRRWFYALLIAMQSCAALPAAAQVPGSFGQPVGGAGLTSFAQPFVSGISPSLHLQRLSQVAAPIVCFVGDSRISLAMGQIALTETLQEKLRKRLMEDNPGKTSWSWQDFSAGGFTWALFNNSGTPGSYPSWWITHGNPPLSYVQAANCDLMIINLGANENAYLDLVDVKGVLNTIAGWTKVPDIIIDTTYATSVAQTVGGQGPCQTPPSPSLTTACALWNAQFWGYITSSGLLRSMVLSDGAELGITGLPHLGLIDLARFFHQYYFGRDYSRQYLSQIIAAGNPTYTNIALTAGQSYYLPFDAGGDIDLDITFPAQASTLFAGGKICDIEIGATYNNTTGADPAARDTGLLRVANFHIAPNGSNWFIDYFPGTSNGAIHSGSPGTKGNVAIPTTAGQDINFHVTAKGGHILVQVNGGTVFTEIVAPRLVGPFWPRVNCQNASTLTINAYSAGVPLPSLLVGTDAQFFENPTGPEGGAYPSHGSSLEAALVEDMVLAATDFRATDAGLPAVQSMFKVSTADLSKSNASFATITGLTQYLTAGKTYFCHGHVTVTAADAAGGAKVTLANADSLTLTSGTFTATNWNGTTLNAKSTATALGSAVGAATAVTTDIDIEGSLVVNAAGTVALQGAENAVDATVTTFGKGSTFGCVRTN